jgi:hypothetical protein
MTTLTPEDREQLEAHGVAPEEAERQLELLASPPAPPELAGPCVAGDGVARIDPERHDALVDRSRHAEPTEGHRRAGDDLVGAQPYCERNEDAGHDEARDRAHHDTHAGAPERECAERAAQSTCDDRAFEADVDHAAPLRDRLAHRGEREWNTEANRRLQEQDELSFRHCRLRLRATHAPRSAAGSPRGRERRG